MNYVNNAGLELTILSREGRDCVVKFTESGSVREANIDNIIAGKVKDLYYPSRYGVGYDGEFDKPPYWKRARQLWSNMMKRCYSTKDTKGYYGRAFVDARWHCFADFLDDIKGLSGFHKWLAGTGMELDKDYLCKGNDTYSKHTCCFLSTFKNRSIQPNYRTGKQYCKETQTWITTKS